MRWGRAIAATAAFALGVGILGVAAPAQAHNYLVSSSPTVDSTISELPAAFSVTTNEPLLNLAEDGSGFALQVTDAAGRYYGDGCLSIDGATLSMGTSLGEAGTYKVVWQVVSEDGHPVSDEFTFTWAGSPTSSGSAAPPVCGEPVVEPVETATPEATPEPTSSADVTSVPVEPISGNAPLENALWIGGAILAVLAAGVVTFLVARRKAPGEK